MNGTINVLKPVGMTSADVVRWIKKTLQIKKVGHTGTLDPGAAGVLPICIGKATRLAEYYTNQKKKYRAELTLGIVTDSQDSYGQIIQKTKHYYCEKEFLSTLETFTGDLTQIPPMFSAVRKNGKHLYEYARQGMEIERETREITIFNLELVKWYEEEFPRAMIDIECSKGTYIRTLCHDLGKGLGAGAVMSFLLRVQTGSFKISDSWTLEEIQTAVKDRDYSFISDVNYGLDLPVFELPSYRREAFKNGLPTKIRRLPDFRKPEEGSQVQVYIDDNFVGIGTWKEDHIHPTKVF